MADTSSRNDIFTAVSIVTLGFMVTGIIIAVVQLYSYAGSPPPPHRSPAEPAGPAVVTGSVDTLSETAEEGAAKPPGATSKEGAKEPSGETTGGAPDFSPP